MAVRSALAATAAAMLWLTLALSWRSLHRSPLTRSLRRAVLVVTAAMTLDIPAVSRMLNSLTPNLSYLVMHALALAGAWAARETMRWIALPAPAAARHQRYRILGLATAVTALAIAFTIAPVHAAPSYPVSGPADFTTDYATTPAMDVYWLIYLGFLGGCLAAIARTQARFVRQASPGPLRTSMLLFGAGSAAGLLYILHKAAYLALRQSGARPSWYTRNDPITGALLIAATVLLMVAGITWPQRGRPRPIHAYHAWAALRRLRPLRYALREVVPAVTVAPAERAVGWPRPPDLQARLYEQVIEIKDGLLALAPYLPDQHPPPASPGHGTPPLPAHLAATADTARRLAAARTAKLAGHPPRALTTAPAHGNGVDWAAELHELTQLAQAWKLLDLDTHGAVGHPRSPSLPPRA